MRLLLQPFFYWLQKEESMPSQKTNKDLYYTSSFHTTIFLMIHGMILVSIQPSSNNPNRSVFVLKDIPNRKDLLRELNFAKENSPSVLVDFRKVVATTKSLKEKLYQEKF